MKKLNARSLRDAVSNVMATPSYRIAAQRLQQEIAGRNSLERACEIAEALLLPE
ncbi:UDP:flavonoid glycosyltransferase YjiC (YdhE family) [Granulicella aggregans]|uniref:UDP:flavonoid glycosyltransferase YjiC (YdhE family) n=1 Tax=Granulicella aggregans TaxID=474949 RepID=A0A7W7ZBT7_9BACT|nr:hypothetical protein [Granulicella aggregans]MBB5056892.1 UDP:flavonoid glycosyltransferase YjiC (YdhE family) [Granulicella aggregans]